MGNITNVLLNMPDFLLACRPTHICGRCNNEIVPVRTKLRRLRAGGKGFRDSKRCPSCGSHQLTRIPVLKI